MQKTPANRCKKPHRRKKNLQLARKTPIAVTVAENAGYQPMQKTPSPKLVVHFPSLNLFGHFGLDSCAFSPPFGGIPPDGKEVNNSTPPKYVFSDVATSGETGVGRRWRA